MVYSKLRVLTKSKQHKDNDKKISKWLVALIQAYYCTNKNLEMLRKCSLIRLNRFISDTHKQKIIKVVDDPMIKSGQREHHLKLPTKTINQFGIIFLNDYFI